MTYALIFLIGWIGSMLYERWKYYMLTGEHLQDVKDGHGKKSSNWLTMTITIIIVIFALSSCNTNEYPRYKLDRITHVPDSLKGEYREWVQETVRAASQNMTGGDYEDVDVTIIQAEKTAEKMFGTKIYCLRKEMDDHYWNDMIFLPQDFNSKQIQIFDSLMNE